MQFPHDKLEQIIHHHCPDVHGRVSFAPIRTGKFNSSFWVHAADAEMVLRIAPPRDAVFVFYERDMMRQEPKIHARAREHTDTPVARVIAYDDSHTLLDRDFILMERLPGRPLTEMGYVDYNAVLRQMGYYLAQVHNIHAREYGYLGAHKPMAPQPCWADAFVVMWNKMIDDVASVGYYDAAEQRLMRELLEQRLSLFDRDIPASLLHMDIWHQNILVDDAGQVTGVVDWDRALWGDPEIEFAVLDYCGISEPAFWEGYGKPRDLTPEARVRQIFYLLYELQKYIVIRHGRNREPLAARRYKQQVMDIVYRALVQK